MATPPDSAQGVLALLLASIVVMGSPGPATISVAAVTAGFGPRRALAYVAGVALGTEAVLLAVALGLTSLLWALPGLAPVLIVLASVYLLYLAYRIATAPPLGSAAGAGREPRPLAGFLLAIANPKAYLAIAAVYAGSALPGLGPEAAALAKTAVLAVMVLLIHLAWLVAGAALSRLLHHPRASRLLNLFFAAVLVATVAGTLLG